MYLLLKLLYALHVCVYVCSLDYTISYKNSLCGIFFLYLHITHVNTNNYTFICVAHTLLHISLMYIDTLE